MFEKYLYKKIRKFVVNNYKQIDVQPGNGMFNFMCHSNSVNEAIKCNEDEVALCVYFHGDKPIIHFINISNGIYVDNTLGYWSKQYKYFSVRTIPRKDFFEVHNIHIDFTKQLRKNIRVLRLFSKYLK